MLTIARWIHVSSVAVLVGGMTLVFLALRPALSPHAEEPGIRSASSFVRVRFRLMAILLTALIVASGVVNIIVGWPWGWFMVLVILKVLAAGAVLVMYFRNAFARPFRAGVREPSATSPSLAPETSLPERAADWKTGWLLAPSRLQLKMELILIAGAFVVILLGVILTSRTKKESAQEGKAKAAAAAEVSGLLPAATGRHARR